MGAGKRKTIATDLGLQAPFLSSFGYLNNVTVPATTSTSMPTAGTSSTSSDHQTTATIASRPSRAGMRRDRERKNSTSSR